MNYKQWRTFYGQDMSMLHEQSGFEHVQDSVVLSIYSLYECFNALQLQLEVNA